jgi:hypothetical protein
LLIAVQLQWIFRRVNSPVKVLTRLLSSRLDLETPAGQIVLFVLGCANILDSSSALSRNFSNIIRAKIRRMKLPNDSKIAGLVYWKCFKDFENRIKYDFRNNGQKWAVNVGVEAEFPDADLEEGYMTFTNEAIFQCFEPIVNRILELIRDQVVAIRAQDGTLNVCPRYIPSRFGASLIHL